MSFETVLDIAGFLGIAVLSVPVLTLDQKKKAATDSAREVETRESEGQSSALDPIAQKNKVETSTIAQRWSPVDRRCLWGGYALLFQSNLGRILV